jgi:hypothetical protein
VAHSRGLVICTWDDDDLYDPRRIGLNIRAMMVSGAPAVFMTQLLIWWPAKELLALSAETTWEGSMFARREIIPVYPAMERHEDNVVVKAVRKVHAVAFLQMPMLYCYTITGHNTSEPEHLDKIFNRAAKVYRGKEYHDMLASLASRLPFEQYRAALAGALA